MIPAGREEEDDDEERCERLATRNGGLEFITPASSLPPASASAPAFASASAPPSPTAALSSCASRASRAASATVACTGRSMARQFLNERMPHTPKQTVTRHTLGTWHACSRRSAWRFVVGCWAWRSAPFLRFTCNTMQHGCVRAGTLNQQVVTGKGFTARAVTGSVWYSCNATRAVLRAFSNSTPRQLATCTRAVAAWARTPSPTKASC